jgi:hypothetical protein
LQSGGREAIIARGRGLGRNSDEEDFLNAVGREGETAGPRAFAPGQMTACGACGRQSPPTRMNCLYCGARLPAPAAGEDLRRPALRPPEEWEPGLNVVLAGAGAAAGGEGAAGAGAAGSGSIELGDQVLAEAASLVQMGVEDFRAIAAARAPLPLARTADAEEAALLERKLAALGLWVETVADEELAVESRPPKRVRRLAFDAEGLAARAPGGGGEEERAGWSEIELIVAGRIFERWIETEPEKERGREEAGETRELSSDESVVDLYFAGRPVNWRVGSEGFDFSCLGAQKRPLAAENFARLTSLLRERAERASFDDSYARLRRLLKFAWPPAERAVSAGLRRARPGVLRAGAATAVSNEQQFTRYGRLLRRYTGSR